MLWRASASSLRKGTRSLLPSPGRFVTALFLVSSLSFSGNYLNERSWAAGGNTILWLPNAVLLGIILCEPKRLWLVYSAIGFFVDLTLNLRMHPAAALSDASLSFSNIFEVLLPAFLLYRVIARKPDLTQRRQLIAFFAYAVILAPLLASFLAACFGVTSGRISLPSVPDFLFWFAGDALGMATVTPLYFAFRQKELFRGRSWQETTLTFILLASGTAMVFWQNRFPFLFVVLLLLLVVGVRLGLAGSALGLLLVSFVGGFLTTAGHGPISLMRPSSLVERDLVFQLFIALTMVVLYVIEVVTRERARLRAHLEGSERRFKQLADLSSDIIVLSDMDNHRHYVSAAVTELLGWTREEILSQSYRNNVHPDDVELVRQLFLECRAGISNEFVEYRALKADGTYRWLEIKARLYYEADSSEAAGIVSISHDIAARKAEQEEHLRAFQIVEQMAKSDALTGIANRRHFDLVLEREWLRATHEHATLSLILMDVDRFKLYNDTYGHLSGDDCLRQVADAVRTIITRPDDLFARYGGEEFVVILPNTSMVHVLQLAERMREAVQQRLMPHIANPPDFVITVSLGCATIIPYPGTHSVELVDAADRALYKSKASGRNRIEAAEELIVASPVLATAK